MRHGLHGLHGFSANRVIHARINYFSFRVNPCNPCLIYISLRDFSVLFEVLVDGIYLFNDECHFVF